MQDESDLLLGCLALRLNHVDPLRFAEAYREWSEGREGSESREGPESREGSDGREGTLGHVLERRGVITQAERAGLERLVRERRGERSVEVGGDHPTTDHRTGHANPVRSTAPPPGNAADRLTAATRTHVFDSRSRPGQAGERTSPSAGESAGKSPGESAGESAGEFAGESAGKSAGGEPARDKLQETQDFTHRSRSRYSLSRVHGTGGLGRVWLAWDEHLQREVALKEVLPDRETRPGVKRRLVKEAQITGQLEHPNIVPVYELVQGEQEGAFYTMRFVRGRTLRERIRDYHANQHASESARMELRRLLTAFVNICHALAYAHARGVLHRDLKPDNVMLGDYGEVIVLDWGLAQVVEQRDSDVDMRAIHVGMAGEVSATRDGTVLGSPAYMSPEQADGRRSLIDQRTDVYGLGAILFCIVTGEVPHRGGRSGDDARNTWELLASISGNPTPRARQVNPHVPLALESICAKAMAKRQADRYASAQELGEDVQRWLADEPVSVYREPPLERLARWTRRHRSATIAAAAALVLIAAVSTVAAVLVDAARRGESEARRTAEAALVSERAARQEATRRFAQARGAVDKSLTGVSRVLQHFPATQTLRTRLLEQAATDYRSFADSATEDPDLQLESARTWVRLGDLRRSLDDHPAAAEAYQTAIRLLSDRQERFPTDAAGRRELGTCLVRLAETHWQTGAGPEADREFAQARQILEALAAESPDDADNRLALATLLLNGAERLQRSQPRSALDQLDQAEREFQELARSHPRREHQHGLAEARHRIGRVHVESARYRPAVSVLGRAVEDFEDLAQRHPDDPPLLECLAACRVSLANAQRLAGDDAAAETSYQRAIRDYEVLTTALPGIPTYGEQWALARMNRAQLLMRFGVTAAARPDAEAAVATFNELVASAPQLARYLDGLGRASLTYGLVLRDLGDYELSLRAFEMAAEEYRQLTEADPLAATYQRHLAIARTAAARTQLHLGDTTAAAPLFQDALDTLEKLLTQWPDDDRARDSLAWCLTYHADLYAAQGDAASARKHLQQALRHRESLRQLPDHLAGHVWLLANASDTELRDPETAIQRAEALVRSVPDNARYQFLLAWAHYRNQDWSASLKALSAARQNRPYPEASDLYLLALLQHRQQQPEAARDSARQAEALQQQNQPGNLELLQLRDETRGTLKSDS